MQPIVFVVAFILVHNVVSFELLIPNPLKWHLNKEKSERQIQQEARQELRMMVAEGDQCETDDPDRVESWFIPFYLWRGRLPGFKNCHKMMELMNRLPRSEWIGMHSAKDAKCRKVGDNPDGPIKCHFNIRPALTITNPIEIYFPKEYWVPLTIEQVKDDDEVEGKEDNGDDDDKKMRAKILQYQQNKQIQKQRASSLPLPSSMQNSTQAMRQPASGFPLPSLTTNRTKEEVSGKFRASGLFLPDMILNITQNEGGVDKRRGPSLQRPSIGPNITIEENVNQQQNSSLQLPTMKPGIKVDEKVYQRQGSVRKTASGLFLPNLILNRTQNEERVDQRRRAFPQRPSIGPNITIEERVDQQQNSRPQLPSVQERVYQRQGSLRKPAEGFPLPSFISNRTSEEVSGASALFLPDLVLNKTQYKGGIDQRRGPSLQRQILRQKITIEGKIPGLRPNTRIEGKVPGIKPNQTQNEGGVHQLGRGAFPQRPSIIPNITIKEKADQRQNSRPQLPSMKPSFKVQEQIHQRQGSVRKPASGFPPPSLISNRTKEEVSSKFRVSGLLLPDLILNKRQNEGEVDQRQGASLQRQIMRKNITNEERVDEQQNPSLQLPIMKPGMIADEKVYRRREPSMLLPSILPKNAREEEVKKRGSIPLVSSVMLQEAQ